MKISIINGPSLNLIGTRETDIYGSETFEHYFQKMRKKYENVDFDYFQSNIEGELINEIQRAGAKMDGIVLNPGGYSHTSVAIGDAVAAVKVPVVESILSYKTSVLLKGMLSAEDQSAFCNVSPIEVSKSFCGSLKSC